MKTALVTGGAGFIGSHLCERLLKDGYNVIALDNLYTGSLRNISSAAPRASCLVPRASCLVDGGKNFTFVKADVCDVRLCVREGVLRVEGDDISEEDANTLNSQLSTLNSIYNLACPASPVHYQATPLKTLMTSIKGIEFCLELAKATGAKLLHASTSEIYGDPLIHPQEEHHWGNVNTIGIRSCYDEGKRVAETMASDYRRIYGVDVRMVRIFNTYGPRMQANDGRVVSNFIVQALKGEDLTIYGDGSQTRSFQYCDDLVEAMRRYMELDRAAIDDFFERKNLGAAVINVGNPGEYTVRELAEKVLEKLPESKSRLVVRPLPGDDPKKRRPDITLAKELLGWRPVVPLDDGLDKTIEYFSGIMNDEL